MPIQAPQWTEYLKCGVCGREFAAPHRLPVSLVCGHSLCRICLTRLLNRRCPFDQNRIPGSLESMSVNTALLVLCGVAAAGSAAVSPAQGLHAPDEHAAYVAAVRYMEELAALLRESGGAGGARLSRPMQRKLVSLVHCALYSPEGRARALRAAKALGERSLTEIILQHQFQNPGQLSAALWAAVRARGCQFLGPAMQEEVVRLVLLALEDGSQLSRKVLVMFVVQRLEDHFPQASKTSVGHVVQLLYRASCFNVSKREADSSLMQLKHEFRTYDALRREHDAQIVQIATEAGLRIAPDQWSALLYGDAAHKSHMQSIIDKLSHSASYVQCVREAAAYVQRVGSDTARRLERLSSFDVDCAPTPALLAATLEDVKAVLRALLQHPRTRNDADTPASSNTNGAASSYSAPVFDDRSAEFPPQMRMPMSPYMPHPVLQILVQPEYEPVCSMPLTSVCDPVRWYPTPVHLPLPPPQLPPPDRQVDVMSHYVVTAPLYLQQEPPPSPSIALTDSSRIDEEQLEEEILALEKRFDQEL